MVVIFAMVFEIFKLFVVKIVATQQISITISAFTFPSLYREEKKIVAIINYSRN